MTDPDDIILWDRDELSRLIADAYNKVGYPIRIHAYDVSVALPEINSAILTVMSAPDYERADRPRRSAPSVGEIFRRLFTRRRDA